MKILKSIYENEVEVKEISVLRSLFIIIMFTLIPGIINFLLTFIMILIDENTSIGSVMIIADNTNTCTYDYYNNGRKKYTQKDIIK